MSSIFKFFLSLAVVTAIGTAQAQDHYSEINGYTTLPSGGGTSFKLGGFGIALVEDDLFIEHTDIAGTYRNNTVAAKSGSNQGTSGGYLSYHIIVPTAFSAGGPASTIDNYFGDNFYVEPSETFPEFAPVDFEASITGLVSLFGRPSGGAYVGCTVIFSYTNETGNATKKFEYKLPSEYHYPPVIHVVNQEWTESDTVMVGTNIHMEALLSMDLNGSGHDTGADVTNTLDFLDSFNAGIVAGAEGVGQIISASSMMFSDGFEGPG